MSIYPGNLSLPAETKDRILTTLKQSIALQKEGRGEEAASGCEFMLRLDPQFTPAKKLLEKIKNPAAAIDLDKLIPPPAGDRLATAREALAARDFQKAINLSTEILTSDFANEEASRIASDARDKMEAAPFIAQFVRKAEARLAEKDSEGARALIQKAQALDSDHPEIAKLQARLGQPSAPSLEQPRSWNPPSPGDSKPMTVDFGTDQSSSFVVDPAAKPAAPPASDFGFTFEEEKKEPASGFSFDSPAGGAAAAAGAAGPGGFDFSTASVETTPEDQVRITQYIADGDAAFAKEQYQEAIDLWSRVFLVDVTHEAASERIEKAKRKRLEIEGKVDELMNSGIAAYDRRDFDGARRRFLEVLALDPSNYSATDYIERLDSASTSAGAALDLGKPAPGGDPFAEDFGDAAAVEGVAVPPPPSAKGKAAAGVSAAGRKSSKGLVIVILGLLVLGGGGYFLYSKFQGGPKVDATQTEATIREAQSMAERKRFDEAIAMLSGIKPEDPLHDRAMELIADFKNRKAQTTSMVGNQTTDVAFNEMLAKAKASMDTFDFLTARKLYEQASMIKPLPPDAKVNYEMASQGVSKLDSAMVFFKEGNYRGAIEALEGLSRQDPNNQSIKQLLANAHFNLGKVALESEKLADAVVEFDQVLQASPGDEIAKRSRDIAERYKDQPKDLLYRIYVKYLPLR